jgi:uncharacterized protein HemX
MAARKNTKTKTRKVSKKSVKSATCSTCHPVSGSHIVSMLLVTVFALGAVLMTAVVIMDQQQQEITAQSVLLHSLEANAAGLQK